MNQHQITLLNEKIVVLEKAIEQHSSILSYLAVNALKMSIIQLKNYTQLLAANRFVDTDSLRNIETEMNGIDAQVRRAFMMGTAHQYSIEHYSAADFVQHNFNQVMDGFRDVLREVTQYVNSLKYPYTVSGAFAQGALQGSVLTLTNAVVSASFEWFSTQMRPIIQHFTNTLALAAFVQDPYKLVGSLVAQNITYYLAHSQGLSQKRSAQAARTAAIVSPILVQLVQDPCLKLAELAVVTGVGAATGVAVTDLVLDQVPNVLSLFKGKTAEVKSTSTSTLRRADCEMLNDAKNINWPKFLRQGSR
jgi:hypothetical protein